jgi:hypothetical protein
MNDDHFAAIDAVIHSVGGSSDPKSVQVTAIGPAPAIGIVFERPYSSDDPTNYFSRSLRVALM